MSKFPQNGQVPPIGMFINRRFLRPVRLALIFVLLVVIAIVLLSTRNKFPRHTLQPSMFRLDPKAPKGAAITPAYIEHLCYQHKFERFDQSPQKRKRMVYDLFLASTELDWLEIRLHTLAPFVDVFVVVEATHDVTSMPKPLHIRENWDRFKQFHHKMLYFVIEDEPTYGRPDKNENFFRDAMLDQALPKLIGTNREAAKGDVLIIGDVDEIPKPETMVLLRHCEFPDRLTLRSQIYHYSFQWLLRGEQKASPHATTFKGSKSTISSTELRHGKGFFLPRQLSKWARSEDLWDASWHCSWCFPTIWQIKNKMSMSIDTAWNTEENREPWMIVTRVRNGAEVFHYEGEFWDRVEENKDVPQYILEKPDRFRHLINRDGEDAAFTDYLSAIQEMESDSEQEAPV